MNLQIENEHLFWTIFRREVPSGDLLVQGTVVPLQGQLLIRIIYINVSVSELISVSEGITVECEFFASFFFFQQEKLRELLIQSQ